MSPTETTPDVSSGSFVDAGRVLRSHGVHGDLRLQVDGDIDLRIGSPLRLKPLKGPCLATHVVTLRPAGDTFLVRLQGIEGREAAMAWHGARLLICADDVQPLPAGEFYLYELVHTQASDQHGTALGQVIRVADNGGQPLLVLKSPRTPAASVGDSGSQASGQGADERLLPALPHFIRRFNRQAKTLELFVPAGLWDEA